MAEPLPRRVIFGAKLTSLLLFIALFVVGAQVALLPLFLLTMLGQPGRRRVRRLHRGVCARRARPPVSVPR